MRKKRVLFQSNFPLLNSGFAKHTRNLLNYLYNTNKYELAIVAAGIPVGSQDLNRLPYRCYPSIPNDPAVQRQMQDPNFARAVNYGSWGVDEAVKDFKPDLWIGAEDVWAHHNYYDKPWFKHISTLYHTTVDSLPVMPEAYKQAQSSSNFWVWAGFAEREMKKNGCSHVKTVPGAVDTSPFYRFSDRERLEIRKKHKIDPETFIVGFVFRNQLRKSIASLLEGYRLWRDRNPEVKKAALCLVTSYAEGWDINKFAAEYNVDPKEILTVFICRSCREYEIKPFEKQEVDCPVCHLKNAQATTHITVGITEEHLNEVYNVMDVYAHPFSSGGMEKPIYEAKLTELITLVTNYSCGEDVCVPEAASLPLDWAEYREWGTSFRKASTYPSSIAKEIHRVYKMSPEQRREMGKRARQWTLDYCSVNIVGKKFENLIDSCPLIEDDKWSEIFNKKAPQQNPDAVIPDIQDDEKWIRELYLKILNRPEPDAEGLQNWKNSLAAKKPRAQIEEFFRQTARDANAKNQKVTIFDLLDLNSPRQRVLVVLKESIGDVIISTAILKSLREQYPPDKFDVYYATSPQYFEILEGNPHIYRLIPWLPEMNSEIWSTGNLNVKAPFDIYINLGVFTQLTYNYHTNHNIALEVNSEA